MEAKPTPSLTESTATADLALLAAFVFGAPGSRFCRVCLLAGLLAVFLSQRASLFAQSNNVTPTTFTYQGRLNDGAGPANGLYDLRFTIYDAASGGNSASNPLTNAPTQVNGRLFDATLDFGAAVFDASPRWLEIAVRTNGTVADYTVLSPRQPLTAAPYAITAQNVNGLRLVQNACGAPNFIGGAGFNNVASGAVGAVIAGGGSTNGGSATANSISADFGFIGGGYQNIIDTDAQKSVIVGGYSNKIWANAGGATVGGGENNNLEHHAYGAVIGGGSGNDVQPFGHYATLAGGIQNRVAPNSYGAAIPGGWSNVAGGFTSLAAGYKANATNDGAFVWSDYSSPNAFGSTAPNQFLIRAFGGVGVNTNNPNGAALNVNGTVTATSFSGSGAALTGINAGNLTGTVGLAQLPGAVVTNGASGVVLSGAFSGNAEGLTNLNGALLQPGSVPFFATQQGFQNDSYGPTRLAHKLATNGCIRVLEIGGGYMGTVTGLSFGIVTNLTQMRGRFWGDLQPNWNGSYYQWLGAVHFVQKSRDTVSMQAYDEFYASDSTATYNVNTYNFTPPNYGVITNADTLSIIYAVTNDAGRFKVETNSWFPGQSTTAWGTAIASVDATSSGNGGFYGAKEWKLSGLAPRHYGIRISNLTAGTNRMLSVTANSTAPGSVIHQRCIVGNTMTNDYVRQSQKINMDQYRLMDPDVVTFNLSGGSDVEQSAFIQTLSQSLTTAVMICLVETSPKSPAALVDVSLRRDRNAAECLTNHIGLFDGLKEMPSYFESAQRGWMHDEAHLSGTGDDEYSRRLWRWMQLYISGVNLQQDRDYKGTFSGTLVGGTADITNLTAQIPATQLIASSFDHEWGGSANGPYTLGDSVRVIYTNANGFRVRWDDYYGAYVIADKTDVPVAYNWTNYVSGQWFDIHTYAADHWLGEGATVWVDNRIRPFTENGNDIQMTTGLKNAQGQFFAPDSGVSGTYVIGGYTWVLTNGRVVQLTLGPPPLDSDAADYITRAHINDAGASSAISQFVVKLKADNSWTNLDVCHPFYGTSSSDAAQNLKGNINHIDFSTMTMNGATEYGLTGVTNTGIMELTFHPCANTAAAFEALFNNLDRNNNTALGHEALCNVQSRRDNVALGKSAGESLTGSYKMDIGPMAQDFYAAVGVGPDDKHIATVDAHGVALAAIQGLNQEVEELKGELNRRKAENADLKRRLEKLEQLLTLENGSRH